MSNLSRLVRPNKLRVRAPRVPIDLEVSSKTIGTDANYSFYTEDISRSGLLLVWEKDVKMPFIINTILEMTIDPGASCLEKPVNCLGKVVRREATDENGQGFGTRLGIQIVQMDNSNMNDWESCLSQLEKRFGIEASNKIVSA